MGMNVMVDENNDTAAISAKTPVRSNDGSRPEVTKGRLDLSRRGYGKLSLRYKDVYGSVRLLDLSHNDFKFINGLNLFVSCVEVQASHNCLERLSSFLSLRNVLRVLDVSNNVIGNVEHVASLTALVTLNLSHNRITGLPMLDRLTHLTRLDVSSNRLQSLPRLCGLSRLEVLNLNGNRISSVEDCQRQLPSDLKSLDIGSNDINDLRQAEHLSCLGSLDSLVWSGNPCVRSDSRTFTYRPFLYSCCYTSLRVVDGYALQEPEIIKGELLCTMSKARRAQTHAELCSILAKHCPIDVDLHDVSSLSSFDDRLLKVMEKRREYLSTTATDPDESSLSFAEYSRREPLSLWDREQPKSSSEPASRIEMDGIKTGEEVHGEARPCTADPSTSATLVTGSTSPPPSASSVTSSSTYVLSHHESHTESISVAKIVKQPKLVSGRGGWSGEIPRERPAGGAGSRSVRSPRISSVRGRGRRSLTVNKRSSYQGDRNGATGITNKMGERRTEKVARAPRGAGRGRGSCVNGGGRTVSREAPRTYSLAQIQAVIRIQARVKQYQREMRQYHIERRRTNERLFVLGSQCEQLSQIVEQQSKWMSEVNEFVLSVQRRTEAQVAELSESMRRCMPTPSRLEFSRLSPSTVTVHWEDVQHKGYALFVDGRECGVIRAPMKKGCVQDLDPRRHSTIEVQCVCGGLRGDRSSPLVIPPFTEDEGARASGDERMGKDAEGPEEGPRTGVDNVGDISSDDDAQPVHTEETSQMDSDHNNGISQTHITA